MMLNARVTPDASLMTIKVGGSRAKFLRALMRAWTRQAPTRGGVNKNSILSAPWPWSVRVLRGRTVRRATAPPASSDAVATDLRTARRR
eukprot:6843295-Prymnesium_polylepis.1